MTPSPSPAAAGRDKQDVVERLKEDAWYIDNYSGFVGSPQRIVDTNNFAIAEIQSLRTQLAEKEKDEGQLIDKYTYQVSSLQESFLTAGKRISDLEQQLEAIRKQTVEECAEKAAQSCRYYLKHQNYTGEYAEFEDGVEVACNNLEQIVAKDIRALSPTTAEEESK